MESSITTRSMVGLALHTLVKDEKFDIFCIFLHVHVFVLMLLNGQVCEAVFYYIVCTFKKF